MITNIPKHTDFSDTALSLLNLAWETTLQLAVSLDEAKEYAPVPEDDYWSACQTQLSTAISLVQQASEFLLKAHIAEVSPFLLIGGTPKEWPKQCNTTDTPFADFYALDAHELIKAHDTVVPGRLPAAMKSRFEEMRRLRNSIMHTVDKRLKLEVKQVIGAILEISDWFLGPKKWIETRRFHLDNSPSSLAYESFSDEASFLLAREIAKALDILSPSDSKRFFGFDKKQRRYLCPDCAYDWKHFDISPHLAVLHPNTPSSQNLHCVICGKDHSVLREQCDKPGCKGNVLDEGGRCLTCY